MTPAERRGPDRPEAPDPGDGGGSEPLPETERYPNGGLKHTGFRLDGELHGAWQWYRTDGSLMRSGAFYRGRQVGPWRTYDRTGRLVKETLFADKG